MVVVTGEGQTAGWGRSAVAATGDGDGVGVGVGEEEWTGIGNEDGAATTVSTKGKKSE